MNTVIKKYRSFPIQAKAAFWFLFCSFLQKGISVITTPIFTRLLSTAEYGKYNVFDSWLKIVTIFVTLHLYSGVFMQGLVKYADDKERYASSIQGLALTLSLIWTVIYLLFHKFWNALLSLTTVQMLAMLLMIWSSSAFNLWTSEQRVDYKYKKLVVATLIISIAKPLVGVLFVLNSEDKVTARILGLCLVEIIGYTGFFVIQMKRGRQFCSKKYWKHALMFNLPLIPHYLSQTVLNSADRIMINEMIGASEAGIYSLAYSISQIMTLFNTALSNTLSPWIYQKIKSNKAEDITRIAYTSLGIIAFVNLTLIAIAPEAVIIFAPKTYHEAIYVIPPVAMSVLLIFSYGLFAKFEFYFEKTKFIMLASVIGALLNIILNYYFIKLCGYMAAAYTTLFCYIIYVVAHYIFMKKVCRDYMNGKEIYDTKLLLLFFLLFFIIGFSLMATYEYPIVRYTIVGVVLVLACIFRKKVYIIAKNIMSLKRGA